VQWHHSINDSHAVTGRDVHDVAPDAARDLKIGMLVDVEYDLDPSTWLALARACDRAGFDALLTSDHYLPVDREQHYGSLDPWALCAAAAVCTDRIALGTLVSPVTFRHPVLLSKAVLTVDRISTGRAQLGLGIGWNDAEHRACGLAFPTAAVRYEMLAEQLELLTLFWGPTPTVEHAGRHYSVAGYRALPKPVRRPRVIVGKRGLPRSVAIATRWADEYNAVFLPAGDCARLRRSLDEACVRAGRTRPLDLSVTVDVVVGETDAELRHRASRVAARYPRLDPDAILGGGLWPFLVGTPGQLVHRLREYAAAGVSRVVLKHGCPDDLESIALLGERVIPAVGGIWASR
jgi:alkanesulfonate monooxygenase SsuD/methylene tetrahydromethanopterin reductase-like flavin-dependent oxidoreductase (luciferase family)